MTMKESKVFQSQQVSYTRPAPATQGSYMAVAMAGAVILNWLVGLAGIAVPGEVQAAVSTLIGWAAGKWGT